MDQFFCGYKPYALPVSAGLEKSLPAAWMIFSPGAPFHTIFHTGRPGICSGSSDVVSSVETGPGILGSVHGTCQSGMDSV